MSKESGFKTKIGDEVKIDLSNYNNNPTSLPLTDKYDIKIGSETKPWSKGKIVTFEEVKAHQILIKPIGTKITNDELKIVIATSDDFPVIGNGSDSYKIVIATSDDFPVVGNDYDNCMIVIATSDDFPVQGGNGNNSIVIATSDDFPVVSSDSKS